MFYPPLQVLPSYIPEKEGLDYHLGLDKLVTSFNAK